MVVVPEASNHSLRSSLRISFFVAMSDNGQCKDEY